LNQARPRSGEEGSNQFHPLHETVEAFERSLIVDALQRTQGSLTRSAEELCIPKPPLHDKIKKYGL
jgi:two-component system response regulator AauR